MTEQNVKQRENFLMCVETVFAGAETHYDAKPLLSADGQRILVPLVLPRFVDLKPRGKGHAKVRSDRAEYILTGFVRGFTYGEWRDVQDGAASRVNTGKKDSEGKAIYRDMTPDERREAEIEYLELVLDRYRGKEPMTSGRTSLPLEVKVMREKVADVYRAAGWELPKPMPDTLEGIVAACAAAHPNRDWSRLAEVCKSLAALDADLAPVEIAEPEAAGE